MRYINKLIPALLVILLACVLSVSVFADVPEITFSGIRDGLTIQGGSEYSDNDLFVNLKGLLPGDVATETVNIKNAAIDTDYIKVYLKFEPHDDAKNPVSSALEDAGETVLSMQDFLSQLNLKVYCDGDLVFNGAPFDPALETGNIYLCKLKYTESAKLDFVIEVPIELGNEYASRMGEVDVVFTAEAFSLPKPPQNDRTRLTVRKLWVGDSVAERPNSVTVALLRDGQFFAEIKLSEMNQWTYTWSKLDRRYSWSVVEIVPDGYTASYDITGHTTTITNTKTSQTVQPRDLTVKKIWIDDKDSHDEITVALICDGEYVAFVKLNESNDWTYTWSNLESSYNWSVAETTVPRGYAATYIAADDAVIITNTKQPLTEEKVSLTVNKVWEGDEDSINNRPTGVCITLYNGDDATESVWLGEWNNWTYTWRDLSADGNWQAIEVDIPKNYTPSYSVSGNVVTITNTATLLQTGQLNWPIPVIIGLGLALVILGVVLMSKKKKNEDA
ncbi:MAG: Cna B-type domain-containing protein [Ruminococcaceae bacterium]|nr:Cna B-type domain-containing protein [Oscillospiraceae bacterium]